MAHTKYGSRILRRLVVLDAIAECACLSVCLGRLTDPDARLAIAALLMFLPVALVLLPWLLGWHGPPTAPTLLLFAAVICASSWIGTHLRWRGPLSASEQVFFSRILPHISRVNRALRGLIGDRTVSKPADDLAIDLDADPGSMQPDALDRFAAKMLAVYLASRGLTVCSFRFVRFHCASHASRLLAGEQRQGQSRFPGAADARGRLGS